MKPFISRGSPCSDFTISASCSSSIAALRAKIEPSAGVKISATKIEAPSTKNRVSGRKLMNFPAIEFQNMKGTKAQSVVRVPLATGQNMRLPAEAKASSFGRPSAMRRSAYSTTTMPPSTRMPTASTIPNMTIMFRVTPMPFIIRNASMKQIGIEAPTIRPWRMPRLAMMIIMTSRLAMIRPDSSTTSVRPMNSLSS